jgi:CRISPR-associated protein Csm4
MTWRLVRLRFGRNPVHFGEVGIGIEETSERVRSDSLFSAWVSSYARLFGKDAVEALLTQFPCSEDDRSLPEPPFRLSSTFVYRRRDRPCYYVPRLLEPPRNYPIGDDLEFTKVYKKLAYLPLEVWQRWYQGAGFTQADRQELIDEVTGRSSGRLRQAGTFDYGKTFERVELPKIAVDRTTRATNLYHTGLVQFQWEKTAAGLESLSGLYFLLYFPTANPTLEDELHAALNLLGEEGIGGERSSGAGRFEVEWESLPQQWQDVVDFASADHHALISLFWERSIAPELLTTTQYTLQERGGWIASPFSGRQLRRKSVQMFAEGSVFSQRPTGKLANVTPLDFAAHQIYRSGISLSLPIHLARQA